MSTQAQIDANRLNSQKSTGPTSVEGKAVTRWNALRHGIDAKSRIIPGESLEEAQQLADNLIDELSPQSQLEFLQIITIFDSTWIAARLTAIESEVFRLLMAES